MIHTRHSALLLLTLAACAKRPVDDGKRPVERLPVAPPEPAAAGSAEPRSAPGRAALEDPCRGEALPDDAHYVAAGLCATVVAKNQGKLRDIEFLPNGDLIGVKKSGEI